jgi:hypothetical protein
MRRIFVLVAIALFIGLPASARVIHVPGNYSTIQAGLNASLTGDTILVNPGTYHENLIFPSRTISLLSVLGPDSTIIQSVNTGNPVITISSNQPEVYGFTIKGGSVSAVGGGIRINGSSARIHGNIIKQNSAASGGAIGIYSGSGIKIYENTLMNNSCSAMGGAIYCSGGSNTEIYNNIIKNNYTGISGGGIFIEYGSGNFVHHNLIVYNRGAVRGGGVLFKDTGRLENNTIAFDTTASGSGGGVAFEERNATAKNNIICQNSSYGVCCYSCSPTLTYNDVWSNAQGGYSGITPGEGSLVVNPQFVGGSPFDFHLTATSPCIDTGSPSSPNDPDNTRADMGAYYFNHRVFGLAFKIPEVYGSQGQLVELPIMAEGFSGHPIGGLEFHISFDQECLEYDSLYSDLLTGADVNVTDGAIHLVWENISSPLALSDSVVLLTLKFWANGPIGSTCEVNWLAGNLAVDPVGNPIPNIGYDSGGVTIVVFRQICGQIAYYDSLVSIPGVNIALSGRMFRTGISSQEGSFCFNDLIGGNYVISPALTRNDPGVTVADVVKIRRHIIQLETFDSPYKYVAADVDHSGTVTVADAVKIQRYLANLEVLPRGNWAFIDSSFAINNTNWPQAPHNIGVTLGDLDIFGLGFIGVRMGDVDGSWIDGDRLLNVLPDTVGFEQNTVYGLPGDTVAVLISGTGIVNIAGIEMHLNYPAEALDFITINSDALEGSLFSGGAGLADLVWNDVLNPITLGDGVGLASLVFRIKENAPESIPITFSAAHAVDPAGNEYHVVPGSGYIYRAPTGTGDIQVTLPNSLVLSQNHPNPFNPTTIIEYSLPQTLKVSIEIYDLLGRRITVIDNGLQEAGNHQVVWNAGDVPSGIYLYKIKAGALTTTSKMLLLK